MAKQTLTQIKNWFKTRLKPTQQQFWDTWDSFWHKDEAIPTTSIEGLDEILTSKASAEGVSNAFAAVNEDIQTLAESIPDAQIQSDWSQANAQAKDYIKNKPTLGTIASKDFWTGTAAAYDAIVTKDANTIYFVEEA